MNKLSPQMINNMTYDEMEVECYVRGTDNVPNQFLVSMLSRTDDIFQDSEDAIDDLESDIKNFESQVSEMETHKDYILSNITDTTEIVERFLNSGKLIVKNMEYDIRQNLSKVELTAVYANEEPVVSDMNIICERIDIDDEVFTMCIEINGYDVAEYEIDSQTVPNIKKEILPYVIFSIVKTRNSWAQYE